MIVAMILFSLKDEVRNGMDEEAVRNHLANMVEEYKKVPGLKEKTFFMNPQNFDQGAFLVWESQEPLDAYLKSDLYKSGVTDICKGEPRWETYTVTATIKDGVLF
jgi:quinol monooxygenase YgiN